MDLKLFKRNEVRKNVYYSVGLSLILSIIIVILVGNKVPYFGSDSEHYIAIAEGQISQVPSPFSGRVFYPFLVRLVATIFSLSIDTAFFVLGIVSLFTFMLMIIWLLNLIPLSYTNYWVVSLLISPFVMKLFQNYYLPDLFYASLLAIFIVSLYIYETRKIPVWVTGIPLFFLFLTRESTIILTIVILFVSIIKSRYKLFVSLAIFSVLALVVVSYVKSFGQPNIHQLSGLDYLVGKILFNFSSNVLGIKLWTNTLADNPFKDGYCEPAWIMSLPTELSLGNIRQIGVCAPDFLKPVKTIFYWLSIFGVMPVLLVVMLKQKRRHLNQEPFWLLTVIIYGLLLFIIGPFTGAATFRLISYGWPVFLIGLPFMLMKKQTLTNNFYNKLLLLNLSISFILIIGETTGLQTHLAGVIVNLCLVLMLYLVAYRTITSDVRPLTSNS